MEKEERKKRLFALGYATLHISIPIFVVIMILNIWSAGIDKDAEMSWNIFITIACFGAAFLMITISFFVHYIIDKYYTQKFPIR